MNQLIAFLCALLLAALSACGGDANTANNQPPVPQKLALATSSSYDRDDLYRFFVIAFNAAPGTAYMAQLTEAADYGLTVKQIVNIFTTKKQFTDIYPSILSDLEFSRRLVENVVQDSASATAKQEAITDVVSALAIPGWTRGDVIYAIFSNIASKPASDSKWFGTSVRLANLVRAARHYTETIQGAAVDIEVLRNSLALSASMDANLVKRDGSTLKLNGSPYKFAGTNADWIARVDANTIEKNLKTYSSLNFKTIRVWAYTEIGSLDNSVPAIMLNDAANKLNYYQYWDPVQGAQVILQDRLAGMDRLLAIAAKYDFKVIMTLTNNWSNQGGMDQYNLWYGTKYHDDFYSDERIKAAYKKYIEAVVNRKNSITGVSYKNDPTILAWELANEPFCFTDNYGWRSTQFASSSGCNAQKITSWADQISTYIRSIDPNHLIAMGNIGFLNKGLRDEYSNSGGDDFEATLSLPNIDFGTFHTYLDVPGRPYSIEWGIQWIKDHMDIGKRLGKPVVMEEFGHVDKTTRSSIIDKLLTTLYQEGASGWLVWVVQVLLSNGSYLGNEDAYNIRADADAAGILKSHAALINSPN